MVVSTWTSRALRAVVALSIVATTLAGVGLRSAPAGAASSEVRAAAQAAGWLATSSGDVLPFGGAAFKGDLEGVALASPIVAMAPTPTGAGYWLVASDGGIFAFGDAGFHGSMGGRPLNRPIVAIASTASGDGYWLVASDGGIFAFGDARFHGSSVGEIRGRAAGMAATEAGYQILDTGGLIHGHGDAASGGLDGDLADVVAVAVAPTTDKDDKIDSDDPIDDGDNGGSTGGDTTGGDNTGGDTTGGDNTGGDNTGGDTTDDPDGPGDPVDDPADPGTGGETPPGIPVPLSTLTPDIFTNGFGPAELDTTNGKSSGGDGGPISIRGTVHPHGLGTHAPFAGVWEIGGACNTFTAVVGIDDSKAPSGSVVYRVAGDGTTLFLSDVLTGASPALEIRVDITGVQRLRLEVKDGDDGTSLDHADWGSTTVWCASDVPEPDAGGATDPVPDEDPIPPADEDLPDPTNLGPSILPYLNLSGDQVVVVPDGRYTGGVVNLNRPATDGPQKGWLILVAEHRNQAVIDLSPANTKMVNGKSGAGPLVIDGPDARLMLVGFAFEQGAITLSARHTTLWYTDHTFSMEDWAQQPNWPAAGLNTGKVSHSPEYPTAETLYVDANTKDVKIIGSHFHDTSRAIKANIRSEVLVQGVTSADIYDYGADQGELAVGHPDLRHQVPSWWQDWKKKAHANPSQYNWIVINGEQKVGYINYDAWLDGDYADPNDATSGWRGYDPNDTTHAEFMGAFKGGTVELRDSYIQGNASDGYGDNKTDESTKGLYLETKNETSYQVTVDNTWFANVNRALFFNNPGKHVSHDNVTTSIDGSVTNTYAWAVRDARVDILIDREVHASGSKWNTKPNLIDVTMNSAQTDRLDRQTAPSGTDPATAWRSAAGHRYGDYAANIG